MPKKKKIDNKNSVYTLELEKQINGSPVTRSRNGKWVNFGKRNDYPYQLLNLYNTSPTLKACVNFAVQSICGSGIDYDYMGLDGSQLRPNYQYSWDSFLRRIATDYMIYGSYAFQIIKNRDGKTYSFYHQPVDTLRCSERDDDGVITSWWIAKDWTATGSTPPVEIESFIMRDDEDFNIKSGKPYIYVYEDYSPVSSYYCLPVWISALKSVQSEVEFCNYDLRMASNCFVPAGSISLPPVDTEEQKQAIINSINNMFVGSSNANSLLISFRNDSDDEPVKFEPFSSSNENVDLFEASNSRNIARILSTFSIPSRTLIGLPEESTGFNSEGALLETAYNLYMTLTGRYLRSIIISTINELFKMNGIDVEITVKELNFLGNENQSQTNQDNTEAPENTEDISENNITEEKTNGQ